MKKIFSITFLICFSLNAKAVNNKFRYSRVQEVRRCFFTKDLSAKCSYFDSESGQNKIADLDLFVEDINGVMRKYGYGRAIGREICEYHLQRIKFLTKNSDELCITGDGEYPIGKKQTYAKWQLLETAKGQVDRNDYN